MTRYLNFSEDFTEKIMNREKIATLRLGLKDYRVGETVILRAGERVIGRAVIREVNVKKLSDLTRRDIIMDGYSEREELIRDLRRFYGEIDEDAVFTQIVFELI